MSPFELDLGWIPKSPFYIIFEPEIRLQSLEEFKKKLKISVEDAQYSYKVSKAREISQYLRRYRLPSYSVVDMVWINKPLLTDATKDLEFQKS